MYPHGWRENDLVLFHNRGVLHMVVGAFTPHQVRAFHQCNLAVSDDPAEPSEDVVKWACYREKEMVLKVGLLRGSK